MKSLLEASFLACILAVAAGCSSADDGGAAATNVGAEPGSEAAPLTQSLVAPGRPPAGINPCAAALCPAPSTCEVVDGAAVCTPIDPPEPSGPFCGGFAGIACPGSGSCVDAPGDGCDPERGGADCGGVCECNVRALCIQGFAFDASPEVCACVPVEPEPDACAAVRCRAGTHCEARGDRARCVRDESEPTNPCAAVLCPVNTSCEVNGDEATCVPLEPQGPFCGGFAGIACPGSGSCVDAPGDGCDPERGGADCGGVCECNVRALCIQGFAFDASPEVCACVPVEPEPDACAAVRCRAGTHCEARGDRARCVRDEAEPTNPCAAVLCPVETRCEVNGDEATCVPLEARGPFCGGIAAFPCPGSGSCVDDTTDDCDPERGGADCGGVCECNVRALCIEGFAFDASAQVCACVPADGSGQACSAD